MSFQEYLNTIRLDKAIKMLISTDMPIIDISNNVGFSNINSFNNLFRDSYNTTPPQNLEKNQRNINWERKRPKTYLDVDRNKALEKLFSYLDMETSIPEGFQAIVSKDIIHIDGKKNRKIF